MNENASPNFADLMRHSVIFGLMAVVAAFVWLMIEYAFGFHSERIGSAQIMKMVGLAFPIAAIALGIMRWRDRNLGGQIKFSQAFGVGLGIGMFFAIGFSLASWLYVTAINPDFIETMLQFQGQAMIDAGSTLEEAEQAVENARQIATARTYATAVLIQMLLASLIISLFASIVVRRKS